MTTNADGSSGVATESETSDPAVLTSDEVFTSSTDDSSTADPTPVSEATGEPDPDPVCGDGTLDQGEACDDGNDEDGDGCSTECAVSGSVMWSYVRNSDAVELEQFAGLALLGEDAVVAGLGFAEAGSQDVLVQRLSPDGDSVWDVVHDVAGDVDRGAGLIVAADTLTVFGSATVTRPDRSMAVERWVGLFSPDDGSLVQESTLGEGTLFGGAASVGGVVLVGTEGAGNTTERAWAGSITAGLALEYAVLDTGTEASQYNDVVVLPSGETFVAGMRGANTDNVADFIVDGLTSTSAWEIQRIAAEFNLRQAQGLAAAAGGDLFVGGLAFEELGGRALHLERFSEAEGVLWSVTESSADTESDEVEAVAVAPNGDVLVTGLYWGGASRDTDVLLRRYDANGEPRWSAELDFAGSRDLGRAIAVTASGAVYVAGRVTTGAGDVRAYVARVVP